MARIFKPRNLPLMAEVGQKLGAGQDNSVYELVEKGAKKPHMRLPLGSVVKVNHPETEVGSTIRSRDKDPQTAAWLGTLYKKNKYDILKHFLGDFIPTSGFMISKEGLPGKERYVEVTIQEKVPQYSISNLSADQKNDPRLFHNLKELLQRMQIMYRVLGEVNARTAQGVTLDAKMDLGGVSDTVRAESLDIDISDETIKQLIENNKSPNLLVDPDTMNLFCIDFDQGQWTTGMDEAKKLAFELSTNNRQRKIAKESGQLAIFGA